MPCLIHLYIHYMYKIHNIHSEVLSMQPWQVNSFKVLTKEPYKFYQSLISYISDKYQTAYKERGPFSSLTIL